MQYLEEDEHAPFSRQELTDWRGARTKDGQLDSSTKSAIRARMAELARTRDKERPQAVTFKQQRLANEEDARAEDWAWRQTVGYGESAFRRTSPCTPLKKGEKREKPKKKKGKRKNETNNLNNLNNRKNLNNIKRL